MIATDSPDVCSLLSIWLHDHHVVAVYDADEALSAVELLHFDLVICDVHLPQITGLDVIRKLKQTQPALRLLAVSGGSRFHSASESESQALAAGADVALLKPFNEEQLTRAVEACVETNVTRPDTTARTPGIFRTL